MMLKTPSALLCAYLLSSATLAAPLADSTQLIANGTRLLQQGKLEPARKAFTAALKANPKSVEALMRLAGLGLAQNDFTSAIGLYKQAIAIDPNNTLAFIGMGIAYLHSGDKTMPRALFEEAIRLEPKRRAQLAPVLAQLNAPGQ